MAIATIGTNFEPDDGEAVGPAERRGKALLGWLNAPDVRNVFYAAAVTTPKDVDAFVAMWEAAQTAAQAAVPPLPGPTAITNLPAVLAGRGQALVQTDQFRTQYRPFGVTGVGSVELADLITPQMWVDEEFVDELVDQVPASDDDDALFDFCFPNGQLDAPIPLGTNGAAFTSRRRHIGGLTQLRVAHCAGDKVTFEIDVIPRPNWLSVGIIESGRIVVRNGVHHTLALLKAGRQRGFFLVQGGPVAGQGFDFQNPTLFKPNQLLAPRPPLVRDYLDDARAAAVATRTMDQYFKFVILPEGGLMPRPHA
jgi:hypothetical protein